MLNLLIVLFCFFIFLAIYFLPIVVAKYRQVKHFGSIVVINVFSGLTGIGWVIALAMACSDNLKQDDNKDDNIERISSE